MLSSYSDFFSNQLPYFLTQWPDGVLHFGPGSRLAPWNTGILRIPKGTIKGTISKGMISKRTISKGTIKGTEISSNF